MWHPAHIFSILTATVHAVDARVVDIIALKINFGRIQRFMNYVDFTASPRNQRYLRTHITRWFNSRETLTDTDWTGCAALRRTNTTHAHEHNSDRNLIRDQNKWDIKKTPFSCNNNKKRIHFINQLVCFVLLLCFCYYGIRVWCHYAVIVSTEFVQRCAAFVCFRATQTCFRAEHVVPLRCNSAHSSNMLRYAEYSIYLCP